MMRNWKYHVAAILVATIMALSQELGIQGLEYVKKTISNIGRPYWLTFYASTASIYIINYKIACPHLLTKKRAPYFILAFFGMILLFAGIRFILEEVVLYSIYGSHNYYWCSLRPEYYIFDNSYYALRALFFSTIVYLIIQQIENKERVHQLELARKTAETQALRSQFSPHFLFNTLNTFYSELIIREPKVASGIQKLSDLLRYVTHQSDKNETSLDEEIQFIQDYIHFYRLRYEDSLAVNMTIHGTVSSKKIPSMVLIHFVENLFKHGVVNDLETPAFVTLTITDREVTIETKNKILNNEKHMESGIGSKNIRSRLDYIFPNAYTLETKITAENDYVNTLKMPFLND